MSEPSPPVMYKSEYTPWDPNAKKVCRSSVTGRPFGFYIRLLLEEMSLQLAQTMNTIGEHKCKQKDVNN